MKIPLTPAMLRTRYHEKRCDLTLPPANRDLLPPLSSDGPDDATAEWLSHIEAGRISGMTHARARTHVRVVTANFVNIRAQAHARSSQILLEG